jgi:hypothetical protein
MRPQNEKTNLRLLKRMFGHQSLEMTLRYLAGYRPVGLATPTTAGSGTLGVNKKNARKKRSPDRQP